MSIRLERDFAQVQGQVAKLEADVAKLEADVLELQRLIQAVTRQATPKGK